MPVRRSAPTGRSHVGSSQVTACIARCGVDRLTWALLTPDPSLAPIPVWVTGYADSALELVQLGIWVTVAGFMVVALALGVILVTSGLRR